MEIKIHNGPGSDGASEPIVCRGVPLALLEDDNVVDNGGVLGDGKREGVVLGLLEGNLGA